MRRAPWSISRVLVGLGVVVALAVPSASGAIAGSGPTLWSFPTGFDAGNHTTPKQMNDLSCGSPNLCVGIDATGVAVTTTDPADATPTWTKQSSTSFYGLGSISCASASFCAAVGYLDEFVVSTDPADGASATWTVKHVGGNHALGAVSCASTTLCVAVDQTGELLTSTDPTDASPTWSLKSVNGAGLISCPTTTFCAAVDQSDNVIVSTDPADGANATWTTATHSASDLFGLSCPSQSLCAAVDPAGKVLTSTDPADGASSTWATKTIDSPTNFADAISCPSASLCVVADKVGNAIVSTDPGDGASATWTTTNVDTSTLTDQPRAIVRLSCAPGSTLCVAADTSGYAAGTADPRGNTPVWHAAPADTETRDQVNEPTSVSCPSISLCVAVDNYGNALATTDPADGVTASWTRTAGADFGKYWDPVCPYGGNCGAGELDAVSCPSVSLCVAVDSVGHIATSTNPSAPKPTWMLTPHTVDGYHRLTSVSCPSTSLCIAVDVVGNVVSSTDPTNAASWTPVDADGTTALAAVSCPSQAFCAAVDSGGDIITSTDPADGAAATWTVTASNVDNGGGLAAVSCPSVALCVAVDGDPFAPDLNGFHVFVSTEPLGDATHWTPVSLPVGMYVDAISCPSTAECIAMGASYGVFAGTGPNIFTSENPTGGAAAWTATMIPGDPQGFDGVSCPSERLCVGVSYGGSFVRAGVPHTLTVKRAGTGSGKVTSKPAGISCGATCAGHFAERSRVTLTAAPTSTAVFTRWSGGGCPKTGTCQVTMNANTTVAATFVLKASICLVPKATGKTLAAAKTALTAAHCGVGTISYAKSKTVAKGKVVSQSSPPGKQLKKSSKIGLVVSSGAH